MKKFLVLAMALLLILPLVSAEETILDTSKTLNPFGAEKIIVESLDSYLAYPKIQLSETFFWFETDKIADYKITNIDCAIVTCSMDYLVNVYQETTLFDDRIKATDMGDNKDREIEYQYYIKDGTEQYEVKDFSNKCVTNEKNIEVCTSTYEGTHLETRDKYVPYNYEKVGIGVYEVRLKGKIPAGESYDVKPYSLDREFTEHAVWTSSLNVNITAYYKLDETSGTVVTNSAGAAGTKQGAPTQGASGKLGTAYSGWSSANYVDTNNVILVNDSWTLNAWVYPTAIDDDRYILGPSASGGGKWGMVLSNGNGDKLVFGKTGVSESVGNTAFSENAWQMATIVVNSSGVKMYKNGAPDGNPAGTNGANSNHYIGNLAATSNQFVGTIDEVGYWARSLTDAEINDLYNGGTGITYTDDFTTMTATQSYPANKYNTTDNTVDIGCNFTANALNNITSVKVLVYDSSNNLDYTNTDTGSYSQSYNKSWTTSALTDGEYNHFCVGYGIGGRNDTTGNRSFTIDTTAPTITIITPSGNQGIKTIPYSVILNYTANDANLQTCRYNSTISATLVTQTCNTTAQINSTGGTNYVYVYANDSFGNEFTNVSSWYAGATYSNATFNNITTEGNIENFKIYIVSSSLPTINSLIYNGTAYNGNIVSLGSNNYLLNNSIAIPLVDSQKNVSFLWNITFNDSSILTTPYFNQTINNFGIDNCTSNSFLLFNFTLYDEDSKTFLNGGTDNSSVKVELLFYNYGTTTLLLNYSNNIPYTNPVRICLANQINSSRYSLDGIIQYSSLGRFPEFYNIQSYTVDNSSYSTNIPLYDLNTSTGTEFKITYKDANFIPVAGALVYIQRKYIEDGLFRTVEIPKTGADGTALGKFVRNDAIYNIIFVKNGVTLATFSNIIPVCQNPTVYNCEINLNSLGSGTIPQDYSNIDGIAFTMTYNKTTRTVSSTYSITSGVPETVSLNLTVNDALGTTIISSDSLLSAGGTLSASVPEVFGNGSITAKLYKSNEVVGNAMIKVYEDPEDIYGASWLFIALFCIIFLVGMAVTDNPMVYGVSLVLGFAMLIMMNIVYSPSIIGVGATILYLVIAIIIIMMKGSERN